MRFCLLPFMFALLLFLVGCGGHVATHYEASSINPDYHDEKEKLDKLCTDLIAELKDNGLIYQKPELTQYINEIGEHLLPDELTETMPVRLYIVRDPIPNAFALDTGDIFINLGLLAFLENESQLAAVIAHEISHSIHRHGVEAYLKHKRSTIAANISDILLLGTGLSYLGAYASIAQHSRQNEKEADMSSFELMQNAGYDVREIPKVFELFNNLPEQKSFMKSIYSSHPENQERISYLSSMVAEPIEPEATAVISDEKYKAFQEKVTVKALDLLLYQHQYVYAENLLNTARSYSGPNVQWDCYEAEIHRLKADNPENVARDASSFLSRKSFNEELKLAQDEVLSHRENAKVLYNQIIEKNPAYGSAYRGMGLLEWEEGDKTLAKAHLEKYLSLEKNITDRLYINRLLSQ